MRFRKENIMSIKKSAQNAHATLLEKTDPEALERINHFAFDEVQRDVDLPDRTKMLSTLAYLLGMQGIDEYKIMLPVALDNGVTPVEAKEVLYQSVDYLGLGRVFPFFKATNDVLLARGVELPLEGQATTTMEDRLEKGEETQIRLFGLQMKDFAKIFASFLGIQYFKLLVSSPCKSKFLIALAL